MLLNSQRINSAFLIFVYENNNVGLSCGNVLVQGGTDGTLTGIELFDHALYLFAKASLVEVKAEDILAAVELFERTPVLIGLANLQGSDDGLQFCQHGVGRGLEGGEVVLQCGRSLPA